MVSEVDEPPALTLGVVDRGEYCVELVDSLRRAREMAIRKERR